MAQELTLKKTNGSNNSKRRIISINSVVKANDGTCVFIGTSKLHGSVRDIKTCLLYTSDAADE